tara:strand:+ start:293 stop:490 length:198 start_codon:yes stop_codon:yes gene_type:complete
MEEASEAELASTRTLLSWKSKVQYKKGTPYISLIKHLGLNLKKGSEVECKLNLEKEKLRVVVELE